MNWRMGLTALFLLATLTWADGPLLQPNARERVRQLRRNHALLREVVANSLSLAAEEDALKRADGCTRMAERLALEIERAIEEQDESRAIEFADHLHLTLVRGVADIVGPERTRLPRTSVREEVFRNIGDRVNKMARPLEARLQPAVADAEGMRRALQAIQDGRVKVEEALR